MTHQPLSSRTVMAGVAVALLLAALAAAGLSRGQAAAQEPEDDGGLTGTVDEVVDGVSDEEKEDEQEAADDGGEPQEVVPEDDGGGGGQEAAGEQAQQSSGGGGDQSGGDAPQSEGSSAPVPSGPQRAAGPRLRPDGGLPEGAGSAGESFQSSVDGEMFATAPEVFSEDDQGTTRRPNELALASLPRENGSMNTAPVGGVPSELIAAATGLLVMVGVGHAFHATRRLGDDQLEDVEA